MRQLFGKRRSAAEDFCAWIRAEYNVTLTFDDQGLEVADDLADRAKYTSGDLRARWETGLSEFVAEVLRRRHGGRWDSKAGTFTIPNGHGLNVSAWVGKRLHFGRQDSLVSKVRVAASLANPQCDEEWDPRWPEDNDEAELLADALALSAESRAQVDTTLTRWLELRKEHYQWRPPPGEPWPALLPGDEEFTKLRHRLRAISESEEAPIACYAFARRHKAHAWLRDWRFGSSVSGPSSYLVEAAERPNLQLTRRQLLAIVGYLRNAPVRGGLLMDAVWRVVRTSDSPPPAARSNRDELGLNLAALVTRTHAWETTTHLKRLLRWLEPTDTGVIRALRAARAEEWVGYWQAATILLFAPPAPTLDTVDGLRFRRALLEWLDSSRGREPSPTWLRRRVALVQALGVDDICSWLDNNEKHFVRTPDTKEKIPPLARWVKGARWHLDMSR